MYRAWVEALGRESGLDVEYREEGKIYLARSPSEDERLEDRLGLAERIGLRAERMSADRLRREEPALSDSITSGLLVHDDFRLDNRKLVDALLESCLTAGVEVRTGVPVVAARTSSGRVQGISDSDGKRVDARAVLIAAGAWSGSLEGLPRPLGVRPIRGQMLAIRPSAPVSARVMESEDVYLVPREDGRLLVGATVEDVGFDVANTEGAIRELLGAAISLVPSLASAPVVEAWAGLRPGTEDGDPIIGPDPTVEGLFYATGHFRNGVLLAPLTAEIVVALIAGGKVPPIPTSFAPARIPETEPAAEGT